MDEHRLAWLKKFAASQSALYGIPVEFDILGHKVDALCKQVHMTNVWRNPTKEQRAAFRDLLQRWARANECRVRSVQFTPTHIQITLFLSHLSPEVADRSPLDERSTRPDERQRKAGRGRTRAARRKVYSGAR